MTKGFVASCFDLGPHLGHLLMLKEAQDNCDQLFIALHVDPSAERPGVKRKPAPTLSERHLTLALLYPDARIIPYESEQELLDMLLILKPDVRFLGTDYENKDFTGKSLNIPIHWIVREHNLSSSRLRKMVAG